MRRLMRVLGQRFVVVGARRIGIKADIELVLPAKFEARPAHRIVPELGGRVALGKVGCMRGDAVGDDAGLHIIAIGQAEMFFRRHVAQHRRAEPADHGGPYARRDVVIAWRDVGRQRPQRIEGRFAAFLQLLVHIDLDLVHRHMAGALDHHLAALVPRHFGKFAQCLQLGELRPVIGIGNRAGAQAIAQRE